jgi:hypothetical protein
MFADGLAVRETAVLELWESPPGSVYRRARPFSLQDPASLAQRCARDTRTTTFISVVPDREDALGRGRVERSRLSGTAGELARESQGRTLRPSASAKGVRTCRGTGL